MEVCLKSQVLKGRSLKNDIGFVPVSGLCYQGHINLADVPILCQFEITISRNVEKCVIFLSFFCHFL